MKMISGGVAIMMQVAKLVFAAGSVRCLAHNLSTSEGCLSSFLFESAALVLENLQTVSVLRPWLLLG